MLNLEKLLRIPDVDIAGGFSLCRDGSHVVFSWNRTGYYEIYELSINPPGEIKQLTHSPGGKITPRYSPDGNYIAWAYDMDGGENYHIILYERASGEVKDLTVNIDFSIQPFFAWSPDSKKIAYLADKTGNFDLYVRSLDGEDDKVLFSPGGPAHFVVWSPDGRHIAVTSEMEWQIDGTYVVGIENGSVCRIGGDTNSIDANQPSWSPDSTKLAFISNSSGWSQIGIFKLTDETIQWLSDDHSDKLHPAWSPDGKYVVLINNGGEIAWIKILAEHGTTRVIATEPGFSYWPTFTLDGNSLLFIYENPRQPPDLWRVNLKEDQFAQLTNSMPDEIDKNEIVYPEAISYPSMDGTPVPALLYTPRDVSPKSPGVVIVHGGPAFHFAFYWNPLVSHLVSRGWTVIGPNYRGSTGYGREWLVSNRYELGRLDSDDCAAAAEYMIKNGLVDPTKIAITGRSHGGYLTMTCLTRNPDLFCLLYTSRCV